ncbi:MAG: thioredoxin domain-containing protein, partial [Solirubrobacterales bacterium]
MSDARPTNRLADATSPYLLQHAHNPVDWFPWGSEALERARREDKPILLSIGYAACHWCHVMERESFEDPATAALMNEHFVSIKVDREERPDLDAVYMDATQAMTGRGGWPLTVFLTPQGSPFYAGTYFPNEDRHGIPAFTKVLAAIAETWSSRRGEAETQAQRVVDAIARTGTLAGSSEPLSEEVTAEAFRGLRNAFDPRWGGFGHAPKFPQPMTLEFVLRMHVRGVPGAIEMLQLTLDRMASGGIHDQIGGGFHRYSTDERWHVPHFEKMLSDNAQLARLYVRAWQVTGVARYREVATRTCDYLLREMRQPDGGFSSSQDADSEGVEGRFFAWTWDELVAAVGEPVASALGAMPSGNWEGSNVPWMPHPLEGVADEYGLEVADLERELDAARATLFEIRGRRVQPATDDKVLAAWNGLAISALAEAGRVLGEPRYVDAAVAAAGFVLEHLRDERGRLLRSWRRGRVSGPAFADDHGLMTEACLVLYETTFDLRWFEAARTLGDELL